MADENLESVGNVDGGSTNSYAETPQASEQSQSQDQPHYVSQSQVNDIVKAARTKAFEKGRVEAQSQWDQQLQAMRDELSQLKSSKSTKSASASEKNAKDFDPDQLNSLVEQKLNERLQQEQEQWQHKQLENAWHQTLSELHPKVTEAAKKYADFGELTDAIDFYNTAPEVLYYVNQVDNTGDLLYHLAQNPAKLATLKSVIRETPKVADREVKRLASSLKENESTQDLRFPPEPLSQIQATNIGGNNGPNTVEDFMKIYTA